MIGYVYHRGETVEVIYAGGGAVYGDTNAWSEAKRRAYRELYGKTETDMRRERMHGEKLNRRIRLVSIYTRGGVVESLTFAKA